MLKSHLVERIAAQNRHLYERDAANIIDAILREIVAALRRGDRVELRGFGVFSVRNRHARVGRDPKTGAHVAIDQKFAPFFKPSKEMHRRLNARPVQE
jgi:integration host factor subunit beta